VASTYCTRANIEQRYGPDNVLNWADIDNEGVDDADITAQINRAIAFAGDIIDSYLKSTPYRIPVADGSDTTPELIQYVAVALAGTFLFDQRGFHSDHQQYQAHRQEAYAALEAIRDGRRFIPDAVKGFGA
jgi:phage gp36-like protein